MTKREIGYCRRAIVLGAALLLVTGCGESASPHGAPGETAYQRACANCHGTDGGGRGPSFPPLAGSEWLELGPDATALIVIHGLRGEIEVAGRTYRGYMPPMNQLDNRTVANILDYIDTRWADWPAGIGAERIGQLRRHGEDQPVIDGRADLEARLEALPAPQPTEEP